MSPHPSPPGLVGALIAVNPLHRPSPRLTAAAARAGALGVLELPVGDPGAAAEALELTARWAARPFGVRLRPGAEVADAELPALAETVLLADPDASPAAFPGRRVLVEVTEPEAARRAVAEGAAGLIVRGTECGGRSGELSTFVLLQRVIADPDVTVPVWACGGIGPHTAVAAVVGGAAGVVLDTQLALLPEAEAPLEVAETLAGLDGSETVRHHGLRVLRRRGPGAPELPVDRASFEAMVGPDLRAQLLPVGQDAFLAAAFARRWSSVAEVVRGLDAALREAVADDAAAAPLDPGSPMARVLGTRLAVAQGPMTRVSDQPAFAAEVAGAGGLPFLALALSDAERTAALLEATRDALGDAPWGVGILGFADEDIRNAQLDVVRRIRPTHAIVAGGRPAQAAALEAEGIATFLHVPSPGLLRQFLDAGARKFIFEGAECGGHVGPRNSFPLWEAQTAVLLDFIAENAAAAPDVAVLFAGGVHDERSAAMTAALAAPLTRAGCSTGVLMGTAYLFTEEAVRAGAITPGFQRRIAEAEETDLLETAPGHATRCARSPFSDDFAALKERLRADGVPDREAWERLERFNVGRLRLASKGIERVGDELRAVDERRQAAEGMFMAGEVVVLRSDVTTLGALHASVAEGAAALLRDRAAELRDALGLGAPEHEPAPEPLRIAVVGMACMFPGAPDLAAFWSNVVAGKDCVTEVPTERWDPALYYAPDGDGERTPSRWGGFLPRIPFDPLAYGIPPASLGSIEPVQLLALEAAHRALADAGYAGPGTDHRRTSVIFGAEAGSDLSNASVLRTVLPAYVGELPEALETQLPRLTEDSFPGMLANVIAGRVANRLNLGGANYTVDAACASSLTAVDAACKELTSGTSDLVLCGGADLHNGINDYLLFSSVHALSPSGRSATFDESADGIALGEGVACVALKRLADAERDGDRIYAVIDGVGSASDGRALGLTAPRPEGQRAALTRAYRNAGISPADVGLVEAHGTGTVVGDRTELATITEVFDEAGAAPGSCAIGSVKSQIGHTKCAAGLAGLIKAVLAVHHGVKPPTLHLSRPNKAWDPERSPFAFHTAARPWAAPAEQRVAGVSAFGFGGTNFHVVLRAYTSAPSAQALQEWPAELFTFRGRDAAAARRAAGALLGLVERGGDHPLRDYARHVARHSDLAALRGEPVRIALVATSTADLPGLLRRAADGEHAPKEGLFAADGDPVNAEVADGALAFLFPGQGSQRPGMLAELLVAFPEVQRHLQLGARWADALYPPAAFDPGAGAEQAARLTDTAVAQPALGIVELAAAELLASVGIRPDMTAGHSYGELVALGVAGALSPGAVLAASAARGAAIVDQVREGDPGAMAAINDTPERIDEVLRAAGLDGDVVTANHNGPRQTVISGPTERVAAAVERLKEAGCSAKPLQVACAFHSPVVAGAGEAFAADLATLPVRAPAVQVWANRTAEPYPADADAVRRGLADGIAAPVRFTEQIEAMYAAGARVFAEVGPGRTLSGLVKKVLGDRPHRTVALGAGRDAGLPAFLTALAQLAVAGVDMRAGALFRGRPTGDPEAAPARRPGWTVDGHLVRRADGTLQPGALSPPRLVRELIVSQQSPHNGAGASGPDALIAEFLRSSRDMVTAQRDVLLRYLGATDVALSAPVAPVAHVAAAPALSAAPVAVTAAPAPAPALAPAPAPAPPTDVSVLDVVRGVLAERTGYPVEMIEPDLDLEADLSVDSIKRAEIAGELARRLGLSVDAGADVEELSAARTAASIAELVAGRLGGTATTAAPAASPSSSPSPSSDVPVLDVVRGVLAERTGYPVEMIEPDLDLEADLSVDSIKRAEIAGELARRLGLSVDAGADVEELSAARTAANIAELVTARLGGTPTAAAPTPPAPAPAAGAAEPAPEALVVPPQRLVFADEELTEAPAPLATGTAVLLIGEGPLADTVSERLTGAGATVAAAPIDRLPERPADTVIWLATGATEAADDADAQGERAPLPDAFPALKDLLAAAPTRLLAVERRTAGAATGLRGFFRSVAREYPDARAGVLEVPAEATPDAVAAAVLTELGTPGDEPVVLTDGATRRAPRLVRSDLGPLAATGAGPAGDGAAEAAAAGLDRDAVLLLVGGARGITARFAATVASAARCRIELVGRTPEPEADEEPAIAAATTRAALRSAFLAAGLTSPATIERSASAVLAGREVRGTLERLNALGATARYHSVDVLDAEAVRAAVKDVHARHGRLDGVVYAAGVIEDKLIAEKAPESFRRVFATKAEGARVLLDAVDELPEGPRFAVLFGSIAGALGNRGQSDYAAANDALEELGRRWSTPERRGLTVHWGPWAAAETNGGMVTPELMRSYAARGIKLIDPEEGPLSLLRELAWGAHDAHAVVLAASGW
ncbi:type I polyketide synthase [Streptomyces radicis]|uniref:SDR family oxidoreductase n=1 Tax=Streptomyces radicis TaxID=1750517 RepID=A0A3A9VRR7_9ACTN|nr:type I polyketide synthase [Streptomyces radicis]RKN03761.1 SDR family oxidoreductase [Streptomyces radicis]RKN13869.1 SDR family oxidoreductase [Streptomyces radicis]